MWTSFLLSDDLSRYKIWYAGVIVRLLLLAAGLAFLVKLFLSIVVKKRAFSKRIENFLTFYYFLAIIFLLAEIGLTFLIKTDNVEHSYANLNWHVLYHGPRNNAGFRDDPFRRYKEKLIIFYGDSFSEGAGIENHRDRYSNIVEEKSNYDTWNMGISGADIKTSLELIQQTKTIPDIFYVQFYFNDLISSGYKYQFYYNDKKESITDKYRLLKGSYLINFIFCWITKYTYKTDGYIDYINEINTIPEVWEDHKNDIAKMKFICDSLNSEMRGIVFPYLKDFSVSKLYTDRLKQTLTELDIATIYVEDLVKDIPLKKRIVNRDDFHASELVNKIIADAILESLQEGN